MKPIIYSLLLIQSSIFCLLNESLIDFDKSLKNIANSGKTKRPLPSTPQSGKTLFEQITEFQSGGLKTSRSGKEVFEYPNKITIIYLKQLFGATVTPENLKKLQQEIEPLSKGELIIERSKTFRDFLEKLSEYKDKLAIYHDALKESEKNKAIPFENWYFQMMPIAKTFSEFLAAHQEKQEIIESIADHVEEAQKILIEINVLMREALKAKPFDPSLIRAVENALNRYVNLKKDYKEIKSMDYKDNNLVSQTNELVKRAKKVAESEFNILKNDLQKLYENAKKNIDNKTITNEELKSLADALQNYYARKKDYTEAGLTINDNNVGKNLENVLFLGPEIVLQNKKNQLTIQQTLLQAYVEKKQIDLLNPLVPDIQKLLSTYKVLKNDYEKTRKKSYEDLGLVAKVENTLQAANKLLSMTKPSKTPQEILEEEIRKRRQRMGEELD